LKNFQYFSPQTLESAVSLLLSSENRFPYAGGTDILELMKAGHKTVDALVDLKNIPELQGIFFDSDGGLSIQALATMNELCEWTLIEDYYTALFQACGSVGAYQVRNRATIAGNICNASPAADTSSPLLLFDAEVEIYGPEEIRIIPIENFFIGPKKNCLNKGEIVSSIQIPIPPDDMISAYYRVSRRKALDLASVGISAGLYYDNEKPQFRLALSAVHAIPLRVREVENFLNSCDEIHEKQILEAGIIAKNAVKPISDLRASAQYRSEMVEVYTSKAIRDLLKGEGC
jgi:carbon-monoxide dehydrogenase medium subunit